MLFGWPGQLVYPGAERKRLATGWRKLQVVVEREAFGF
jgi:hypothetical protein